MASVGNLLDGNIKCIRRRNPKDRFFFSFCQSQKIIEEGAYYTYGLFLPT